MEKDHLRVKKALKEYREKGGRSLEDVKSELDEPEIFNRAPLRQETLDRFVTMAKERGWRSN